ncbi:heterokaryon incompatibility protein-domain-containing protein [Xylaria bambusicola]|uniref:heterokaryon incompatibility protein-domain-containing protein n=1 Tax=Xylaria bambusicola TaxID=326684 RepID=UPI002008BB99|nr:heterokaryon incompatibility protein-domain-containing protein [Xylaria bambusicola]KAI0508754.1 heterokaryon incompatibility protein-domain-containing protein [Xylaria bambusicola]
MAWLAPFQPLKPYEYPDLRFKPGVFRVIKLLPPTRSWFPPFRETLNIEILEVNVDDATDQYDTLSYSWGDSPINRTVVISHFDHSGAKAKYATIRISASLESALLSLARNCDTEDCRPIFADQICINQASNVEKIVQVRLMGLIYSRSIRTIVWLGEGTTETRRCFDFSSEINGKGVLSRVMGPNVAHYMNVFDAIMEPSLELKTNAEREDRDDLIDLITRYGTLFPLRGLTEILHHTWFNRLWTVQEGCLPTGLVFRCGDRSQCYDCIRGLLLFYSMWNTYWLGMPKGPVAKEELRLRNEIFTLNKPLLQLVKERKAIHTTRSTRRALNDIVIQYNVNDRVPKIGASRAEDRIYALLGLARNDEMTREITESMEVNNVKGSFTKFAASVIKRNVDVLLFSQWPKSIEHGHQLPSWVPDWAMDPLRTPHGYSDLATPVYCAGGRGNSHDIVTDVSTGVLRLNAFSVGRVIRVGVCSIEQDKDVAVESIEYMSVRAFFDEIDNFVELAADMNATHPLSTANEDHRLELAVRLSDGGLSARQFPAQFDPSTANSTLQKIHVTISQWGKKRTDVEAKKRSMSSFTGMIRSAGIMPWYWTPASEVDVIRLCATDPIAAARLWIQGVLCTMSDMGWVIWYVAKLRLHTAIIRVRRTLTKQYLTRPDRNPALENVGLPTDLVYSKEWELYTSNLFKNMGRKLFLTDTGYIGLGPDHMKPDDNIIVVPGSTVPHVLRRRRTSSSLDGYSSNNDVLTCSYVGEAYCDGVMDGELIMVEGNKTQVFEIA